MTQLYRFLLCLALVSFSTYGFSQTALDTQLNNQHHIDLPFNQYSALKLLAKWQVSSTELPAYTEINSELLFGSDYNNNNVRDDYEKALLAAYKQPEYVVMGLLATSIWQRLLQLYNSPEQKLSEKEAIELLVNSMSINHCYYLLQQVDQDLMSPILIYFNTQQRLTAKKEAEHQLLSIIGNQQNKITFPNQPCTIFANLIHSEPLQNYIKMNNKS
ncbi:hypothetical protein A3K86_21360 [Photobacterium jeanii]|uniref:Uncharacterized protein n=1 Tax=Photobacterium jeanii TaxID=858640 RepID=A0A178K3F0_9GAMM|nr:hypothetical protein [Photobacterium jeanii]OAN11485.1 hypothetical protein A3K86_21360 [Photobacterium jeanii]PST91006.1 hypothetical protein C9I91_10465 [Photobacterium jeanii]